MLYDIFISYSRKDKKLRDELMIYLSSMISQGLICDWNDEDILPGAEWELEAFEHLNRAHIILLLISPDFIASHRCYKQMQRAIERYKTRSVLVIPVLLRATDINGALIEKMQALPSNNKPVSNWSKRDNAFLDIVQGIRTVIKAVQIPQNVTTVDGVDMSTTSAPLWSMPFRRNLLFTGREEALTSLYEVLSSKHIVALSGLGGIGKTQIAIEYVYRLRDTYQAVFWVRAHTSEELTADFVSIAELLNLPEYSSQEPEAIINAVIRWFTNHKNWLLIFNNVDDFSIMLKYLPPEDSGHILLTTRTQVMGGIAYKIEIPKLDTSEAVLLLLRRAGIIALNVTPEKATTELYTLATEIVKEVDGLPLAIDQIGAYVEETQCSLSSYLMLYRQHHTQLLAYRGGIALDYPLSVSTTWELSFQDVEKINPSASELLKILAFFSPESIPQEILTEGARYLGPLLESIAADHFSLNTAIKILLKYSLLYRDHMSQTITIHRLVQTVIKDKMDDQTQKRWAERAVSATSTVLSDRTESGPYYQRYIAHALICASYIEQWHIQSREAAHLLHEVACYLYRQSRHKEALPLFQQALLMRETILGPEHTDVAETLTLLAHIYYGSGQYTDAALLYQRALTIWEKARGPENPNTLRIMYHLARLYRRQGDYTDAAILYQKILAMQETALGSEHPQTVDSLQELAELYRRQEKYTEAAPLLQKALAVQKRVFGLEHSNTALTLYHLARVYYEQLNYAEALPLTVEALAIAQKEFGAEHLTTTAYRVHLARLYASQSDYAAASLLLQKALAVYEKALGAEHLHTAITLRELAQVEYQQGNVYQALALFQRALTIIEKVLTRDHPDMAAFLYDMARFYHDQSNYPAAMPFYQRCLTIQEHVLGMEHPKTRKIRDEYMHVLHEQNLKAEP